MGMNRDQVLSRLPTGLREPARHVLEWLLSEGDPVDDLSAYEVLQFVWYTVPVKWAVDADELAEASESTAAIMDAVGRPRVATLIRSTPTVEIQRRWLADDRDAVARYTKALADSGYDPPDTDRLAWGSVMGIDEVGIRSTLARVLEQAVEAGTFVPGRSGWRRTQASLAEAWLTTPSLAHRGSTPVEVVHAERREAWLRGQHPRVRELAEPMLVRAAEPPPDGAAQPLRWLLDRVGDGLTLTQATYLPTAVVAEAKQWYDDWILPGFATRSESDLPPLLILREFAQSRKLLTRRSRRLTVSATGRAAMADPHRWWNTVVTGWFSGADIVTHVAEVAAVLMLDGAAATDIVGAAVETVAPKFRHRDWSPADWRDIEHALSDWTRPGNSLGFIAYGHALDRRTLTDTAASRPCLGCSYEPTRRGPDPGDRRYSVMRAR
jgi:hypothetical protein